MFSLAPFSYVSILVSAIVCTNVYSNIILTDFEMTSDTSSTPQCRSNMYESAPFTEWCYGISFFDGGDGTYEAIIHFLTIEMAADKCSEMFGAQLPSINSEQENEALSTFVHIFLFGGQTAFWIGLKCGGDGKWRWDNGEAWSGYTHFKEGEGDPDNCDPVTTPGYIFNNDEEWERAGGEAYNFRTVSMIICTKRPEIFDSTEATTALTSTQPADSGLTPWEIALIIISLVILFGISITVIIIRRRFQMLKAEAVQLESDKKVIGTPSLEDQSVRYYTLPSQKDKWEIKRSFVGIDYTTKLGTGAFGSVYLGRVLAKNIPNQAGRSIIELSSLKNNNDAVAVKMLHENAETQNELDFRAEIELMKRIGYHERIVNIIACITLTEPILLITEYCANGDLLEFMRQRRQHMFGAMGDSKEVVTVKKQIMFSVQIAYGLEYLASRGYIHRDIAARNIMVDQQESCKIGDFGLCRVVGNEDENYQAQGGKLPLRWMSPEAIDKYLFSTASDVWSFGILLFEIVTLGGNPYAGWPAAELLTRLRSGERMQRPESCSEDLFSVMSDCWKESPTDRPTATILRKRLGKLLEDVADDDYYVKLNAKANYYMKQNNDN